MAGIDQNRIMEIRKNADIVEIIKSYIPLVVKGKNYFGVCPFHQDHSPSMSVSKEKQLFKCFSCGAGGNVFTFVKDYLNVSFLEAVSIVAEKIGMTFNVDKSFKPKNTYQEEYDLMEMVNAFFMNSLNTEEGKKAKEYLKKRNLTSEIIKEFKIGLSLENNELLDYLKKRNKNLNKLEELGVLRKNNLEYYEIFKKRIIFPIEDPSGQVVGFIGRVYEGDLTPKYLNSKETVLFKKGNILFNYHRAKEHTRIMKKLIVVEGNMDAIRLSANGYINTIALMGTALTKEQIGLIRKLRVPLTLMLDNDEAGKINTYQNGLLLERENISFDVVRLSGAKDPDEYILNYGKEKMSEALEHPMSFLEFKLDYLKENKNLQDANELAKYIEEVIKTLENTDILTKDITIRRLAKEYDISYDLLKSEIDKQGIKQEVPIYIEQEKKKNKKTLYELCSEAILYYMMNDVTYIKMYQNKLGHFNLKTYRQIKDEILGYYEKYKTISLADFLSYAEISPIRSEIINIEQSFMNEELTEENMEEYIRRSKEIEIDDLIVSLKKEQKQTIDFMEKKELGMKIVELKKKKEEMKEERSVKND